VQRRAGPRRAPALPRDRGAAGADDAAAAPARAGQEVARRNGAVGGFGAGHGGIRAGAAARAPGCQSGISVGAGRAARARRNATRVTPDASPRRGGCAATTRCRAATSAGHAGRRNGAARVARRTAGSRWARRLALARASGETDDRQKRRDDGCPLAHEVPAFLAAREAYSDDYKTYHEPDPSCIHPESTARRAGLTPPVKGV
jgi:hypothetical protein